MYEITDVIHDYLFVTLRLRNVQTGVTRDWRYWDDLEEWLCKEHGVKDLKGLVIDKLPDYGDWVETGKQKKPDLSRATQDHWSRIYDSRN